MRDLAIRAENLLKEYHIYDSPLERLKELFFKARKHRVFTALGPVDIEIRKGETLGIIGENGAGKSTFLKLVAGVIEPSSGSISVKGKVSSILELGVGFNPELSGKENIFLNGALHGFNPSDIEKRINKIERFADIGEFFHMPVKTYSSGMYVRLAFSLAVHVDADIIVIDEALSVGDGAFEKKCIDRIWDLKRRGVTIIFCSHSLYAIANFCDRAMWLKNGRIEAIGETKDVISRYEDYLREKEDIEKNGELFSSANIEKKVASIKNIRLFVDGKTIESSIEPLSNLDIIVDFEIFDNALVNIGFAVDRSDNLCCYATAMYNAGVEPFRGPVIEQFAFTLNNLSLLNGTYKIVIFLLDETGICVFDRKESQVFKVLTDKKEWGICRLPFKWHK